MPSAQIIVRQSSGQSIVLSPEDRIVKEVTITCESGRCASRHGQQSPVSFTFNDQDPFPAEGDSFMSLILPERSPSNKEYPRPFCGPQCLKDYLSYEYVNPGPRFAPPEQVETVTAEQIAGDTSFVRKTDNGRDAELPVTYPAGEYAGAPGFGGVLVQEAVSQADGASE